MALATGAYSGFNHSHLTEMLADPHHLSRSTVRRVLLAGGIGSPRRRRTAKRYPLPTGGNAAADRWEPAQLAGGSRTTSDSHRLRGRRHRDGPLRSVPSAGGRPRLHADAQGDNRSPRNPNGPVPTGIAYSRTPPGNLRVWKSNSGDPTPANWALGSSWPIHRRPYGVESAGVGHLPGPPGLDAPRRHSYPCQQDAPGLPATIQSAPPAQPGSARQYAVLCFKYLAPWAVLRSVLDKGSMPGSKSKFDWTAASWSSIRAGAWLRPLQPVTLRAQKGPRRAVVGRHTSFSDNQPRYSDNHPLHP